MQNGVMAPPVLPPADRVSTAVTHVGLPSLPLTVINGEVSAVITAWTTVALVAATLALAWLTWILARATSRIPVTVHLIIVEVAVARCI